ncbi:MAG: hypothetical protein GWP08_20325, partial [Nitrospiraceae bacterium]|nr:hypothetical protein [Nitrospiraceae bacterium]
MTQAQTNQQQSPGKAPPENQAQKPQAERTPPTDELQETTALLRRPVETQIVGTRRIDPANMFLDGDAFNQLQRVGNMFAASQLVPTHYRNNVADCSIAIQQSARMKIDVILFMSNTYVVHGTLGMSAKLQIALTNTRGPFNEDGIQWSFREDPKVGTICTASATKRNGQACTAEVSWKTVVDEGWVKNTKWTSLRDLMFKYRSASFLIRLYAPECLMGLKPVEELEDMEAVRLSQEGPAALPSTNGAKRSFSMASKAKPVEEPVKPPEAPQEPAPRFGEPGNDAPPEQPVDPAP